jgi:hypothetical protein
VSETTAETTEEKLSPLAQALWDGIWYRRVLDNGRLQLILGPEALDAICHLFELRQRHMPLPEDAIAELRYWQQHLCGATLQRHSRSKCDIFTTGPYERCAKHQAIDRIHPGAAATVAALTPRARTLFEQLLDLKPSYGWPHSMRPRELTTRFKLSQTSLYRTLRELDEAHLTWSPRRGRGLVIHPAVAFFDGAADQRKALDELRLDRRHSFAHLEPPTETTESEEPAA